MKPHHLISLSSRARGFAGSPERPFLAFWGGRPSGGTLRFKPVRGQIAVSGIHRFDQRDLFLPSPTLDLLLAADGVANVPIRLKIDQSRRVILLRESLNYTGFVLPHALAKTARNAGVEGATRTAHHHVDVIEALAKHKVPPLGLMPSVGMTMLVVLVTRAMGRISPDRCLTRRKGRDRPSRHEGRIPAQADGGGQPV